MAYFKYEKKLHIFLMGIIIAIPSHLVRNWLIYAVQSLCLSGRVDIYRCLFNQKWLGTSELDRLVK